MAGGGGVSRQAASTWPTLRVLSGERRLPPDLALGFGFFGIVVLLYIVGLDDDLDLILGSAAAGLAAAMCENDDWVREAD